MGRRALVHADALDVFTGSRIDFDNVAFLDKSRDLELTTGLGLGWLGHTRCRIASHTRLGLDDLQGHVRWRGQGDRIAIVKDHCNGHPLFKVLPVVIDLLRSQFVLLVALVVHEDKRASLVVKKLGFEFFNVGHFKLITTLERPIQDRVSDQVLELALVESIAFSRLHKVHFGEQVGFAVNLNFQAFSQVAGFVSGHSVSVF